MSCTNPKKDRRCLRDINARQVQIQKGCIYTLNYALSYRGVKITYIVNPKWVSPCVLNCVNIYENGHKNKCHSWYLCKKQSKCKKNFIFSEYFHFKRELKPTKKIPKLQFLLSYNTLRLQSSFQKLTVIFPNCLELFNMRNRDAVSYSKFSIKFSSFV